MPDNKLVLGPGQTPIACCCPTQSIIDIATGVCQGYLFHYGLSDIVMHRRETARTELERVEEGCVHLGVISLVMQGNSTQAWPANIDIDIGRPNANSWNWGRWYQASRMKIPLPR